MCTPAMVFILLLKSALETILQTATQSVMVPIVGGIKADCCSAIAHTSQA